MPMGIYPRTKEQYKKIGLANKIALKGKHNSIKTEFKKGSSGFNRKHIEETKRKISEGAKINPNYGMKNKRHTEETKIKIGLGNKGKKLTEETKLKISMSLIGKTGELSRGWQGGKSFEPYGIEFNNKLKEFIRKRNNYRCQQCFRHQDELFKIVKGKKLKNYKLYIHHIDYDKTNNSEDNLIPLCNNCHLQTNFKREDWTKYFQNKLGN